MGAGKVNDGSFYGIVGDFAIVNQNKDLIPLGKSE